MPAYRPGKRAQHVEDEYGIIDAIKLSSNEHPMPTLAPLADAVADSARSLHLYADSQAAVVRERIADHLGVSANQVTVGNGSVALLQQLCLAYVDSGDEVVYPWRSFEVYPVFTRLMNGVPVEVPLAPDLGVDLDAIVAAMTPATKLVFIATPNNPTGVATTTTDLRRLIAATPRSTIVCVDEAYHEFVDPSFGDPISELVPEFPNLIVTRTFSKVHGLAGARVGYAVGHPAVISAIDKTALPFAVSAIAQAAALAALDHLDEIDQAVSDILAERARVETELTALGWVLPHHQGNFVWLTAGERTDAIALSLERRGVVVRAFSGDGIRVTISTSANNDRFLAALAEAQVETANGI